MMNHNLNYDITLLGNSLLVPNIPLLNVTNNSSDTQFGSLGLNAEQCNSTWDYPPKFLNVDYYNVGNGSVFEVYQPILDFVSRELIFFITGSSTME